MRFAVSLDTNAESTLKTYSLLQESHIDPVNILQTLVYTLLDVLDATRDLYQTLKVKERREYEQILRAKGYPNSRRIEYVEADGFDGDEAIVVDKAATKRQFEVGNENIGAQFAIGDGTSPHSITIKGAWANKMTQRFHISHYSLKSSLYRVY